jgi:hypothetical protein
MSIDIDAMFAGMAGAQMNGKGRKLGDGKYRVTAKSLKLKKGGYYGDSFIFEFDIAQSANADHPVGSGRSYTVNLKSDYAMGDMKALIFALIMGKDPGSLADIKRFAAEHAEAVEWFKAAIDPDVAKKRQLEENFVAGLQVDVEVEWRKSEKTGKDWALHRWSPAPEPATPSGLAKKI